MKSRIFSLFLTALVLFAFAFAFASPSAAASPQGPVFMAAKATSLPPLDLTTVLTTFASLTGAATLIAAIVNSLKALGLVGDGDAPKWSAGLNLLILLAIIVLQVLGKTNIVPALDSQAGTIAGILTAIVGLVYQIFVSRIVHENALAGLPVIGTSASGRTAGDGALVSITGNTSIHVNDANGTSTHPENAAPAPDPYASDANLPHDATPTGN